MKFSRIDYKHIVTFFLGLVISGAPSWLYLDKQLIIIKAQNEYTIELMKEKFKDYDRRLELLESKSHQHPFGEKQNPVSSKSYPNTDAELPTRITLTEKKKSETKSL